MNRLLVLAAVAGAAALLLFHRPAAPVAAIAMSSPAVSQPFIKGHPSHTASPNAVVYVAGAVRHPGLYRLHDGARIDEAVRRAGGFLAGADAAEVNLAQRVTDGEEIRVVRLGETPPTAQRKRPERKRRAPPAAVVDLNAADAAALSSLPGIGETLAERIVEYRHLNGPFASLDELADVAGMTQRRIDAITPYVTLHSAP